MGIHRNGLRKMSMRKYQYIPLRHDYTLSQYYIKHHKKNSLLQAKFESGGANLLYSSVRVAGKSLS